MHQALQILKAAGVKVRPGKNQIKAMAAGMAARMLDDGWRGYLDAATGVFKVTDPDGEIQYRANNGVILQHRTPLEVGSMQYEAISILIAIPLGKAFVEASPEMWEHVSHGYNR